ncbi:histidine kinase [Sporosarcina sp. P21c]|uniref:bifunctional diguanylate cyclase/phosphodiesterase n=1 Tax=unclassified Sporosarcina TaxID=2647733 RepID=UPI000C171DBD|nr:MULTISPECIES: EAL domain-containing protein [unclassified Sporosarcina]PIC67463.1 histidine kinase [Sporosarcina sp. P16a]PIC83287.1 histidine kinase [Sporosarcina sp. P1]PIC89718.1 histidine kinase [Sporosarcina sp. P21c]PIC92914.1 histidine kinase [Sporosarcina sp. P25]
MVKDQTRYLRLANITKLINTKLELREVLNHVITAISEEIVQCDSVGIYLPQQDGSFRGFVGKPEVINGMTLDMHTIDTDFDLLAKEVIETRRTIYIPDTSKDFRPDQRAVEGFKIKSLLVLPITGEMELFGLVFLFDYGIPMNLTELEIQTVQSYVNMAAVAIQNAKLLTSKEELIQEKQLLLDITRDLSLCSTMQEALDTCFLYIERVLGNNDIGVHLIDPLVHMKIKPTTINHTSDWSPEAWVKSHDEIKFDDENDKVFQEVIASRKAEFIPDVFADDRVNHEVCRYFGIQSMFILPLVSMGKVLGLVVIADLQQKNPNYSQTSQQLTQSIVDTTASTLLNLLNMEKQELIIEQRTAEITEKNNELESAMKELQRLSREKELILHSAGEGIFGLDLQGVITFCNPAAAMMLGYKIKNELIGKPVSIIYNENNTNKEDVTFFRQDQSSFPVEYVRSSIKERDRVVGDVVTFKDISERKKMEKEIRYHAYYDSLTNLPNRVLLKDRMEQGLSFARIHEEKAAVLFMDLDRFKSVNDLLGHSYGDILLAHVAKRICACLPEGATASRQGGDEFIIYLPSIRSEAEVVEVAEKIVDQFNKPFNLKGHEMHIHSSMGISVFPQDGQTVELLIKNADIAMYQSKTVSGSSYHFYQVAMDIRTFENVKFENALYKALDREELEIYFQPQIDYSTRTVIGTEVLLRWNHSTEGLITPDKFIALAEETGLIVPIGEWVIRSACNQMKKWQAKGYPPIVVSVNLSARQFEQNNLFQTVKDIVDEEGVSPELLCLEITENQIIKNTELTIQTMKELQAIGIKMSIDDFGTGYSSLGYLKNLPINALKIDKSFIQELESNNDNSAIANTIITLAKNLGLDVVAEGVETLEQAEFLASRECYIMQGYYFNMPLKASEFESTYLATRGGVL